MAKSQAETVEIRPFGEGGEELGMTRAEILEHLDALDILQQASLDGTVQLVFAWLIAMFFVAHRLTKLQFLIANGFYLIAMAMGYFQLAGIMDAMSTWSRYGGFYMDVLSQGKVPTIIDVTVDLLLSGYSMSIVFWSIVIASIWWAISCRKNQPLELGSPL